MDWRIVLIVSCGLIPRVSSDLKVEAISIRWGAGDRSKITGTTGDNIIIDSKITNENFAPDQCTSNTGLRFDYKCYKPVKNFEKLESPFEWKPKVILQGQDKFDDYFVWTSSEAWFCHQIVTLSGSKCPMFHRIVNRYLSKMEISNVTYPEHIEVSSVNYLENERRTRLTETLDIFADVPNQAKIEPKVPFQYPKIGRIRFFMTESIEEQLEKDNIPNKYTESTLHFIRHTRTENGDNVLVKEVIPVKNVRTRKELMEISTDQYTKTGRTLRIGRSSGRKEFNPTVKNPFRCDRVSGISPVPDYFLTEIRMKVKDGLYAKISKQDFSKYFALIRNEVWLCISSYKNNEQSFYRVLNEIMGVEYNGEVLEIKEVEVELEIVYVDGIETPNKKKTIRFKEIGYFDVITKERLTHDFYYELKRHRSLYQTTYTNIAGIIKKDVSYQLKAHQAVYKTLIAETGYDLRVESRVTSVHTLSLPSKHEIRCLKITEPVLLPEYSMVLKVKMNYETNHMIREFKEYKSHQNGFFKQKTTVWKCTSYKYKVQNFDREQVEDLFHRILNEVTILVPVRFIETSDGVEVVVKELSGSRVIMINEIKYYSLKNKRLVIVDGNIDDIPTPTGDEDYFHAVSKDIWDETVQRKGHMYMSNQFRDPTTSSNDGLTVSDNENNKNQLSFYLTDNPENLGNKESIVTCTMIHDNLKPVPKFKVTDLNGGSGNVAEMASILDKQTHARYFDNNYASEARVCTNKAGQDRITFTRIKTTQSLRKDKIKDEIRKVIGTSHDRIWLETDGGDDVVKMINIRYYQSLHTAKNVEYSGYIVNEAQNIVSSPKWKSGTEVFSSKESDIVDITFNKIELRDVLTCRYREPVSSFYPKYDGYNIEQITLLVGSRWEQELIITDSDNQFICTKDDVEPNKHKQKLQTEVFRLLNNGTQIRAKLEDHFQITSTELFKCESHSRKMYRVLNRLRYTNNPPGHIQKIEYFDGFYVYGTHINNVIQYKFVEVKYLDETFEKVLKFEGYIQMTNIQDSILVPLESCVENVRRENSVVILKGTNRIFRFPTTQKVNEEAEGGLVMEVGESLETKYSILNNCGEVDETVKEEYLPRVIIKQDSGSILLGKENNYDKYFEVKSYHRICVLAIHGEIVMVKNILTLNNENYKLNALYFHEGIKIYHGNCIEETKFIISSSKKAYNFNGYVERSIPDSNTKWDMGLYWTRINYYLDFLLKSTSEVIPSSGTLNGISLEIHNPSTDGKFGGSGEISCRPMEKSKVDAAGLKDLTMEVWILRNGGADDKFQWRPMTKKERELNYIYVEQEIWECGISTPGEPKLYRIIDKIFAIQHLSTIHHSIGTVKVTETNLPTKVFDNEKYQLITVQRLGQRLDDGKMKFLDFDGQFILETDSSVLLQKLFSKPTRIPDEKGADVKVFSAEVMRHFAIMKYSAEPTINTLTSLPRVDPRGLKLLTEIIDENARRVFKIGRKWESVITAKEGKPILCTKDEWTKVHGVNRYIPKVDEDIDGEYYELEEDAFLETFTLKNTEVWMCTNKDVNFVRVVTKFELKVPIMAVHLHHGVDLKVISDPKSTEITETIFIDALNEKVLRYDGDLKVKIETSDRSVDGANKASTQKPVTTCSTIKAGVKRLASCFTSVSRNP